MSNFQLRCNKLNSVTYQERSRGANSGDEVISLVLEMLNLTCPKTSVRDVFTKNMPFACSRHEQLPNALK